MAKISPFKAIRPTRDKVHLVATRPYYSYRKHVLKAKLDSNPFTFLHIINPEFGLEEQTRPHSDERFKLVSNRYEQFLNDGILVQDEEPTLYVYKQTKEGHSFIGVIGGANVEEYDSNKIKKHEATLTSRQELFTNYLNIVGYNAEPVLLSYSGTERIDQLLEEAMQIRPEFEFTTTDRIKHELWKLTQEECQNFVQEFDKIEELYIADGHHRSASSSKLNKIRNAKESSFQNENSFLACLIAEKSLKINEYNRLVQLEYDQSNKQIIDQIRERFEVKRMKGFSKPTSEHQIVMCLRGDWYLLTYPDHLIDKSHPVKSLDAEILTNQVLEPILGIENLKTDTRISFISGAEPIEKVENKISTGEFDVAFILFPVTIEQVKKVADNQLIMPPKSTWIEPKLRSGLTIYNINE